MVMNRKGFLNLLFGLADRLGRSPRLCLPVLLEAAQRNTGLYDYGDPSFLEPAEILVSELRAAELTPLGRRAVSTHILAKLANRLLIEEFRRTHPELARESVPRPIVVTGNPRTGTTLLQRLLALDPYVRAPAYWETLCPVAPLRGPDQRRRRAQHTLARYYELNPRMRAIHHVGVDEPGECLGFLDNTFVSLGYFHFAKLPSYLDWVENCPDDRLWTAYSEYCFQLKALQREEQARHWVLKAPAHLPYADVIERVFDASTIVVTHRDPRLFLPSLCSLLAHMRSLYQERVDNAALGAQITSSGAARTRRFFDTACHREGRVLHVAYEELIGDPVACVARIYARASRPLTPTHEQRIASYMRDNPIHKHGVHRYSLAEFGLDERTIASEWRFYDEFRESLRWSSLAI